MKTEFIRYEDKTGIYYRAPGIYAPHRFTTRTGKPDKIPLLARQRHSDRVLYVTGEGDYTCDGFITDRPGVAIAVKTADCTPVLMHDAKAGAAAAVHAGWRGTAARIVLRAYEKMLSFGASADSIRIAIGPSVCFDCYEVEEDFRTAIRTDSVRKVRYVCAPLRRRISCRRRRHERGSFAQSRYTRQQYRRMRAVHML